ncbi:hypothetical protein Taro_045207, partial [Colocasia esculenta]|nr:hypothetical protein [Colocasia esculenta]
MGTEGGQQRHKVNLASGRGFGASLTSSLKETFFPDDPFRRFKNLSAPGRAWGTLQYYIPILEWGPKYSLGNLRYDALAGLTIASLAIPQGISYARLANLPPIIGLYSSFVPPLIYAIFGSSKNMAVGTVAAASLLLASIIEGAVSATEDPVLYVNLFYTAALFTGILQAALGFFRLGILVDFLSRSTIIGFMGGTATIIIMQQLKGMLGMRHFTTKTDVISVAKAVIKGRDEVGPLKRGLNPLSIGLLNFDSKYLKTTLTAGVVTGILALAEGIAVGRSFAIIKNDQIDGNKEMIAYGMMNIAGSLTSCYLTTGPFSKTAVNVNAGCKTPMSNVVMSLCMMLVLLFLAPLFQYTPLVGLSAIIITAMVGLIEYEEMYHIFKVDKFDFVICMTAFFGVVLLSMDIGLMLSVGIAILRALIYMARPNPCKLGHVSGTTMYRDIEQYVNVSVVPGILIIQAGSPIYFANSGYLRERIFRWIEEEIEGDQGKGSNELQHVILDMGGVASIDKPGIEMLQEVQKTLDKREIKLAIVNPRMKVVEKLAASRFIEKLGTEWIFLSINDAQRHQVNLTSGRGFRASLKETFFPDDPFRRFKNRSAKGRAWGALQYYVPILEWGPKYSLRDLRYDILAGITIASLAIPQGISYARLANLPPIMGLCTFVPPLIYAIFGSSKNMAVGTVAAASLLLASIIEGAVSASEDPILYVSLFYTAALFTGILQAALGLFRLGILVDFLSRSTIIGFMGGTATIIIMQQLKGMLGMRHFTTKTDVISVAKAVIKGRDEWQWQSFVLGVCFLCFLFLTRYIKAKKPKLFWVSAMSPFVVVVLGGLFAFLTHGDKHGIPTVKFIHPFLSPTIYTDAMITVGPLKKGLNPLSIGQLNFESKYLKTTLRAGVITGILALAEGIAVGRSFAILKNDQIDGNKEMIAYGMMNIVGSMTSCYLTTGPFSKTAVNVNAGCKTPMSNVVMSICMMLVLLFLAPLFQYTPLVALSAIIITAMVGLIEYHEMYHIFKVDKFDFCICISAFLGVVLTSMDIGLLLSVGISIIRALLYMARPNPCKLGRVPGTTMYRDIDQYANLSLAPGILIIQAGSPIYFANSSYLRERILRWIEEDVEWSDQLGPEHELHYIILDMG